jgi:hypothetical protein
VVTICTTCCDIKNVTFFYVLCDSPNKQRLFPYTALTGFVCVTETVFVLCETRTEFLFNVGELQVIVFLVVGDGKMYLCIHVNKITYLVKEKD